MENKRRSGSFTYANDCFALAKALPADIAPEKRRVKRKEGGERYEPEARLCLLPMKHAPCLNGVGYQTFSFWFNVCVNTKVQDFLQRLLFNKCSNESLDFTLTICSSDFPVSSQYRGTVQTLSTSFRQISAKEPGR